ncbi:MAG: hypothetical protein ACLP81_01475 [Acidimicrobiales bacterium]
MKPGHERKLDWAEKHLVNLAALVTEFEELKSYVVTHAVEHKNKPKVWRLHFTAAPDERIDLIAGDVLYNVRASLDYLAASLVPSSERSHVMFPIVDEDVWDIPFEKGENAKRTDMRQRWETTVKKMNSGAVEVLKDLQPLRERDRYPEFHVLDMLNRLSNKDRHRELHVFAWGLADVETTAIDDEGWLLVGDPLADFTGLADGAILHLPPNTVDVHLNGTPAVVIRGGEDGRHIRLPHRFVNTIDWVRNEVFVRLAPYLRRAT